MSSAEPPVLDLETIRQLQSRPGSAGTLLDDLAPVFLSIASGYVREVTAHLRAGDHDEAANITQQLISAATSFGATRLALQGWELQDALIHPTETPPTTGHLERELAQVRTAVEHLGGESAPRARRDGAGPTRATHHRV